MSTHPNEPKFITNLTLLQAVCASIAVTMFFCVWAMGWDIVANVFKPGFVDLLTTLRVTLMAIGIVCTSVSGRKQLPIMLKWAIDNYRFYQELKELKKNKE